MSVDLLVQKIKEKGNPSVSGLDPKIEYVPEYIRKKAYAEYGQNLKGATEAIWEFNKGLIDALYDVVPAVKPLPYCLYHFSLRQELYTNPFLLHTK